ncbi:hypothetical protein ACOMHN_060475 [Nucella lapillus]
MEDGVIDNVMVLSICSMELVEEEYDSRAGVWRCPSYRLPGGQSAADLKAGGHYCARRFADRTVEEREGRPGNSLCDARNSLASMPHYRAG